MSLTIFTRAEAKNKALSYWTRAYHSGKRIAFDEKQVLFFRNCWTPRLRVEECKGYNVFRVEPLPPTPEDIAEVRNHAEALFEIFAIIPPAEFADRFFHLLNRDFELYPLQVELERQGYKVKSIPVDGGHLPLLDGDYDFKLVNGKREVIYRKGETKAETIPSQPKEIRPCYVLAEYLQTGKYIADPSVN